MLSAVKSYFENCPALKGRQIFAGCLNARSGSVSVEQEEADPVVKRYVCGGALMQCVFTLAVRVRADGDPSEGLRAAELLEEICSWVRSQNEEKLLPELQGGAQCEAIEVLTSPHTSGSAPSGVRGCIKLRLLYEI